MKTMIWPFFGFLALAVYLIGFYYLMDAAIMAPVEIDPSNPVYSSLKIAEWIIYIAAGGAIFVRLVVAGRE